MASTASVQTDASGNSFIELEGRKIPLGSDFSTQSVGVMDVVNGAVNRLNSSAVGKYVVNFSESLKSGDQTSIIIAGTVVIGGLFLLYNLFASNTSGEPVQTDGASTNGAESEASEDVAPRDFTIDQLRDFDGKDDQPIYIGLKREVFDVSRAKDFYGEGSGYHCFAGREASRAMALLSFDESELANPRVDDLGAFGRGNLDDWYEKFKHYKSYPVVGRVSFPPTDLKLTREQLKEYDGTGPKPEGREDAPIYIGLGGNIFDVSYGGKEMYAKPDGPYSMFVGIDASRALAKMSFDPADLNSSDLSDLTAEELEVLKSWEKKFKTVKKYPIVGKIV